MSTNNGLQGSSKVLTAQQRDIEALQARTENPDLTWQQIANRFGYASRGAACKAVLDLHRRNQKAASDEFRAQWDAEIMVTLDEAKTILGGGYNLREEVEEMLLEGGDITAVVHAVTENMRKDSKLRLEAIDRILKINERLARMHGYDAPAKLEATGAAGFPIMVNPNLLPDRALEALREDAARAAEQA